MDFLRGKLDKGGEAYNVSLYNRGMGEGWVALYLVLYNQVTWFAVNGLVFALCALSSLLRDDFFDLPRLQTARADDDLPGVCSIRDSDCLEVGLPAAVGPIVGVTDPLALQRSSSTDGTGPTHGNSSPRMESQLGWDELREITSTVKVE